MGPIDQKTQDALIAEALALVDAGNAPAGVKKAMRLKAAEALLKSKGGGRKGMVDAAASLEMVNANLDAAIDARAAAK